MENKQIPKREEKLWSEIKNYQVATNNARILGVLDELIINEKTGNPILPMFFLSYAEPLGISYYYSVHPEVPNSPRICRFL